MREAPRLAMVISDIYPDIMSVEEIEHALGDAVFEPLRIRLLTGQFLDVLHPNSIFLHEKQLLILDRTDATGQRIRAYRFIDHEAIKEIIPIRLAGTAPATDELASVEVFLPGARFIDWFESLLALLASGLICGVIAVSGIMIFLRVQKGSIIKDSGALVIWAILISIEVLLLIRIARFYRQRQYPLPLLYALRFDPNPRALSRVIAAMVWLLHGGAGVMAFAWLDFFFSINNYGRTRTDRVMQEIILLAFVSAGAHASMMFFLLAARAAGATPRLIRRLWRMRILIDIFIVAGVALFPGGLQKLMRPLNLLTSDVRFVIRK